MLEQNNSFSSRPSASMSVEAGTTRARDKGGQTTGLSEMRVCFQNLSLSAKSAHKSHSSGRLRLLASKQTPSDEQEAPTTTKTIFRNVTGCFKPGEMTLVIGQPGSGKSALMKVLAGRFPMTKAITLEGDVSYNGIPRDQLLKRLPQFVSYVTQKDTHIPILSVQETFQFAYDCHGGGRKHATNYKDAHATRGPTTVVEELGLQNCQNTIIGDAMLRGVSGGERKRVTTGEMQFGMHTISLMDEISTGLDSAATFDIVTTQRRVAKKWGKTIVISLLQPSPEVFALFDNVLLMNEGEVMYNGPREQALAYFESLGFVCPPRRDVADYLCDLGTDSQVQYQQGSPPAGHARHPRLPSEFADFWAASTLGQMLEADVNELMESPSVESELMAVAHVPEFYQSFWSSTWTLTKRELTVLIRNVPLIGGRLVLALAIGLIFASLFYNVDLTNAQLVMGLIFSGALYVALGQASMLAPFIDARDVFYKQRSANFYRTSSYVVAASIGQLPLIFSECVIFGALMYWTEGLVASASAFVLFIMLLFLQSIVIVAFIFFLSSASPNLHIAEPVSMIMLLLFILTAGFMVVRDDIPDYMGWLYWISPFSWGLQAMSLTQYLHEDLDRCVYNDYDYCANTNLTLGKYSLSLFDMDMDTAWVGYAVIFLIAEYIVCGVLSWAVLEYHRYEDHGHGGGHSDNGASTDSQTEYNLVATPRSSQAPKSDHDAIAVRSEASREIPPVTLAFHNLWYTVTVPNGPGKPATQLDLLKGITGYAQPRTMTALMGSTGAGKTTLMDVIAARKTSGKIQGKILLNGHEASDLAIRRCTAYCEQMDVHSEAATFREALTFSAFLRRGQNSASTSQDAAAQVREIVDEVLDLLGLDTIANQLVRGSSMEQMKRLTIGVELAAQPSVLFLDEPTSGLDARSAKLIMDGVRRVADSGRTVVCTIHQPSSEVFFLFDNLLLLQRGGRCVYFGDLGERGQSVIDYFEAMPGVATIKDGYNPATWMLEVIGAGVSSKTDGVDFPALFEETPANQRLQSTLNEVGIFLPEASTPAVEYKKKRAASNRTQFMLLSRRFFEMYWRTPSYTVTRYVITVIMALVTGLLYLNAKYTSYQGVNGGLSAIYMANSFLGFAGYMSVFPIAFGERAPFYRERAAQTYNSLWYFVASTIVEIPYGFTTALVFVVVFIPMLGFTSFMSFADVVLYWFMLGLHILFQAYLGQLLVFALPSIEVAAIVGVFFDTVFFMFMGFNPPAGSIPKGYKWLYSIVPQRFVFDLHGSLVFGQCGDDQLSQITAALAAGEDTAAFTADWSIGCQVLTDAPPAVGNVPIKTYIGSVFDIKYDNIGHYLGVYVALIVVTRTLAALAMRYINHQKR